MLRKIPFFLLTIPFIFLINMANYYFRLLDWSYVWPLAPIYLGIPVLLYLVFAKLTRAPYKTGIVLCYCLIVLYFFAQVFEWIRHTKGISFVGRYSIMLPLVILFLFVLVIWLWRKPDNFPRFYYFVNLASLLLLAGGLIQFAFLNLSDKEKKYDHADSDKKLSKAFQACDTCNKPDIYFFIFDGYSNSRTLLSQFNYNNSELENQLKARGFIIPTYSRSNYNFTHMSIASELNMDYLYNLDNSKRFYTKDFFESYYTIYHNEWCDILRKQGYRINNYSHFAIKDAPVQITPSLTELNWRSVWGQTFFNKLQRDIGWHLSKFYADDYVSDQKKERIRKDTTRFKDVYAGILHSLEKPHAGPQFVYGHFLLPHEKYYYDSSGHTRTLQVMAHKLINKTDYIIQTAYTNKFVIIPIVDAIIAKSKRPFVIIIQSDHGYRSYPLGQERFEFENLNAIYFPDKDYRQVSDTFSSVNTFRVVANKYFHQNYPMLKDSIINLRKANTIW